jgi:hypothetical protein
MTPEEALESATDLLLSPEYRPIVIKALTEAKDFAAGAAILVAPIIVRMMQETDIPDEELTGSEDGDGIAVHLLKEVFEIAAQAGLIEDGEGEPTPEAVAMAQKAGELVGDMLAEANGAIAGAAQQPQGAPTQQPAPTQQQQAPAPQAQPRGLLGAV